MMTCTLAPVAVWVGMAAAFHPVAAPLLLIAGRCLIELRGPLMADLTNQHLASYNRATVLSVISLAAGVYMLISRPLLGYLIDMNMAAGFAAVGAVICVSAYVCRPRRGETLAAASCVAPAAG